MIKEVVMYRAECDGCGRLHGDGEDIIAWESANSAQEMALCSDWVQHPDGRWFCFECRCKIETGAMEE
jgi:hypothetical protein